MPKGIVTEPSMARQPEPDHVRAGMQLANATIAAVTGRSTAYRNRSVGDFIRALISLGVDASDDLGSIEIGISQYASGYIHAERDEFGAWEIREVRP